jgi:hypothetical protein
MKINDHIKKQRELFREEHPVTVKTEQLLKPFRNWVVKEDDNEIIIGAKFINSGRYGMGIVAVVNREYHRWTAYWGGCDPQREYDAYMFVRDYGDLMDKEDAMHFFPYINRYYHYERE